MKNRPKQTWSVKYQNRKNQKLASTGNSSLGDVEGGEDAADATVRFQDGGQSQCGFASYGSATGNGTATQIQIFGGHESVNHRNRRMDRLLTIKDGIKTRMAHLRGHQSSQSSTFFLLGLRSLLLSSSSSASSPFPSPAACRRRACLRSRRGLSVERAPFLSRARREEGPGPAWLSSSEDDERGEVM